jgi:hypothetical protein
VRGVAFGISPLEGDEALRCCRSGEIDVLLDRERHPVQRWHVSASRQHVVSVRGGRQSGV